MSNDTQAVRALERAMDHLDQAQLECRNCEANLQDGRKYVGGFDHALRLMQRAHDAVVDIYNAMPHGEGE